MIKDLRKELQELTDKSRQDISIQSHKNTMELVHHIITQCRRRAKQGEYTLEYYVTKDDMRAVAKKACDFLQESYNISSVLWAERGNFPDGSCKILLGWGDISK